MIDDFPKSDSVELVVAEQLARFDHPCHTDADRAELVDNVGSGTLHSPRRDGRVKFVGAGAPGELITQ